MKKNPSRSLLRSVGLCLWLALMMSATALFAQTTISGVVDKTIYVDRVSFVISNQPGFTCDARLDDTSVAVGTPVIVGPSGYRELALVCSNNTTAVINSNRVRFIVSSSERGGSEDGLPPWTPSVVIPSANSEFSEATLRLVTPQSFPAGLPIPVVAWVENSSGHAIRVSGDLVSDAQDPIAIRRGVGSGFINATNPGLFVYQPSIGGLQADRTIQIESNTTWISVSGLLSQSSAWPTNSRVQVTGAITNPAGSTLRIGAGTVVCLKAGVDFYNHGHVVIEGTVSQPVLFMPAVSNQPWGGIIQHASNASVTGSGAMFIGSGANGGCWFTGHGCSSSLSGIASHRGEQALFSLKGANCNLSLTDSAAIYHAGQFGHSTGGVGGSYNIALTRFLMQRVTTGGEYTDARFSVNDSAFIECPDATRSFVDGDNDGLYLVNGTHGFTNTLFGWIKDDGVDSGADGSGTLEFQNCWFESIFHEANSLSGTGKNVRHYHDVFIDCGQAVESGYDGPSGTLDACLATGNLVGARFGDNYNWTYNGSLRVTNSLLLFNFRNVWGMTWADWLYRTNQMVVRSNWLNVADPIWPSNQIWDPAVDSARLASFFNGPNDSVVGIGVAVPDPRLLPAALTNGLPVRLSRFTTNHVTVQWVAESELGALSSGELQFSPGQTLRFIRPNLPDPDQYRLISISLVNASGAEVTGFGQVFIVRPAATTLTLIPKGSVWRFLDSGTNFGNVPWNTVSYPDSTWPSGPAQLGFGDDDENTPVSSRGQVTTYFRHSFEIEDPAAFKRLTVSLLRDDGGIVYLNGTEIFRSNLRSGQIDYLTLATNALAQDESYYFYTNTVGAGALRAGTNVVAAEIHQSSLTSGDLSFDLQLDAVQPVPLILNRASFQGRVVLQWEDASAELEEALAPSGPWLGLKADNPYSILPTFPQRYYRLRRSQ